METVSQGQKIATRRIKHISSFLFNIYLKENKCELCDQCTFTNSYNNNYVILYAVE